MLLLTSCVNTIAVDSCASAKPTSTKDALVRGSSQFKFELGPPPWSAEALSGVLFKDRDILTQQTAAEIVAGNRFYDEVCPK